MITGFNTDVRHGGVVFHVQTEDKGTNNPCVESLVYVGGQILARKRSGYQSLLEADDSIAAVTQLMEDQHRMLVAAIRAGKMDQKAEELTGKAPKPAAPSPPPSERVSSEPSPPSTQVQPPADAEPAPPAPAASAAAEEHRTVTAVPLKKLLADSPPAAAKPAPRVAKPAAVPRPLPKPVPPPKVESKPAAEPSEPPDDRSLDQVILDYLEMESEQEKLVLTMDHRSGDLGPGKTTTVSFRTRSSLAAEPIGDARITVRLISTIGEPRLLGQGRTNDRGQLEMTIKVPELQTGTGALIVSAESLIGKAEMRHLI